LLLLASNRLLTLAGPSSIRQILKID
jgi:hypothetical protein